jgi:hypothetical protein
MYFTFRAGDLIIQDYDKNVIRTEANIYLIINEPAVALFACQFVRRIRK